MYNEQYENKAADAFAPLAKAAMGVKLEECMAGERKSSPEFAFTESFRGMPYEKDGAEPMAAVSVSKVWEKAAAGSQSPEVSETTEEENPKGHQE